MFGNARGGKNVQKSTSVATPAGSQLCALFRALHSPRMEPTVMSKRLIFAPHMRALSLPDHALESVVCGLEPVSDADGCVLVLVLLFPQLLTSRFLYLHIYLYII